MTPSGIPDGLAGVAIGPSIDVRAALGATRAWDGGARAKRDGDGYQRVGTGRKRLVEHRRWCTRLAPQVLFPRFADLRFLNRPRQCGHDEPANWGE
jgi:hypothetical protein